MRKLPVQNPDSRFESVHVAYDDGEAPPAELHIVDDKSQSIVSKNASPDIGFEFSVNPYRGCMHACAYCYARPTHEYLGYGAGTDFDRVIVVKRDAAKLLQRTFEKRSWKGKLVAFSGVTDCYQPLEKSLELTKQCLEVCLAFRNPVGIVTKSALIERDLELLVALQREARLYIAISLPFLDHERARALEPYAPSPTRRLHVIERLAKAGLEVGVSVAPLIPGLSEDELPALLQAARDHGATRAGHALLRLPGAVKEVFETRLRAALPLRADKILNRLREAHGGTLYRSEFGKRHTGEGEYASQVEKLFRILTERVGLMAYVSGSHMSTDGGVATETKAHQETTFRRPQRQLTLF